MENDVVLKNIEAERGRHNQTKSALASILGISTTTYLSWIRDKTEIPSNKLIKMKTMWNVTADYLLEKGENDLFAKDDDAEVK